MGYKRALNRRSMSAWFSRDQDGLSRPLQGLDGVALVRRCAEGAEDSEAWQEFLYRFLARIRYFVARAMPAAASGREGGAWSLPGERRPEVEDLAQETLLRLTADGCRLLKRFHGETEEAVLRYLSVVATSVVLDHFRVQRRARRLAHDTPLQEVDPEVLGRIGLQRDDLRIEQAILVRELLALVEDGLREEVADVAARRRHLLIFKLHVFDGLSLAQIARFGGIGLSKNGVDKTLTRIRERLRERLCGTRGTGHG